MANTAAGTVEELVKLGVLISNASGGKADWGTFLNSPEYKNIQAAASQLAQSLGSNSIAQTITSIAQEQQALLQPFANDISKLPMDKLLQFNDLGNLKLKLQHTQGYGGDMAAFAGWLVEDALPVLLQVAPVVIPLLL